MGKIILEKMEFNACHGVYDMEKIAEQKFFLTLTFEFDMKLAGQTDLLEHTIDYQKMVDICKEKMRKPKSLIEKIAFDILQKLHEDFPIIKHATVVIEKPEAQLGIKLNCVSVTVNTTDLTDQINP